MKATELTARRLDGGETALAAGVVSDFAASLDGPLLRPGEPRYDEARTLWNAMIDRKPALIARCAGAADVARAVQFARAHELAVSVRGGDHSAAGNAMCDAGLAIDLAPMNEVSVDPAARTAWAGGGTRWREFDAATTAHGLATTGGTNSDTGIGGLTLGGGLGWLAGKYGLACDNLIAADVVAADGQILSVSEQEHPDLFWGIRGGSGNFGVVTRFRFRLHEVGTILGGLVLHPLARAKEVLRFYADFSSDIPDELNTVAALQYSPEGQPLVGIGVCYNGDLAEGEKIIRPLREFGPPIAGAIGPMPYGALQTMLDPAAPRGRRYYWKANLVESISADLVDELVEHFQRIPSPLSLVAFQQLGNAARRVGKDETAFSHRDCAYDCVAISGWQEPRDDEQNVHWTREFFDITKAYAHGMYVNGVVESDARSIRAAYRPETLQQLVALKNKYDPRNLFRQNANIKPSG